MAEKISQETVKRLLSSPPLSGNKIVWDGGKGHVTGFGIRVTAASAIAFVLRYVADGRERRITIGKHPDLPVAAAREIAAKMRGRIAEGADPLAEREERRRIQTISALCDRYLDEHLKVHNRPRTQASFKRLVEKHIKPALGHHKITGLARADIKAWHNTMRNTPTQANRSLAVLRKILSLASVDWELRGDNPARSIKLFPETKRERVLSGVELRVLSETVTAMLAAGEILDGAATAVWLLVTTGCRLSEILELRWEDVATGNCVLKIRSGKAGGRDHQIGASVAGKLAAMKRSGPWVVSGTDAERPLSLWTLESSWKRIRHRAGLTDTRLHDLRHGYGTEAGNTGANAFQVRDALGHKTLAMTGRYVNRGGHAARTLADRVAGNLDAAWSGHPAADVIPLPKPTGGAA